MKFVHICNLPAGVWSLEGPQGEAMFIEKESRTGWMMKRGSLLFIPMAAHTHGPPNTENILDGFKTFEYKLANPMSVSEMKNINYV